MGTFHPRVQCKGVIAEARSCGHVLADIPATTELEVFGPGDDPHVTEALPYEMVSGEILTVFYAQTSNQNQRIINAA